MNEFDGLDHHLGSPDQGQSGWDFPDLWQQLGQSVFSVHREHGPTVGTPGPDARDDIIQTLPFDCDVVSQEMILHEFGVNVSEAQLVYDAASHGWLTDHGTSPQDMAQLLELHGVHTHTQYNGSLDALTSELAQGHKVIVAVDSGELWNSNLPLFDLFHSHEADHAIVVTGLDMSDPGHPKVFVNDPGDPQGAGKPYPLDQFLEAWSGSGNMYVATNGAPPHLADQAIFGANYHPEIGMYMDPGFWVSFFKGLSFAAANYVVTHHDSLWPTNTQEGTAINPWEHMSGAERNDLFLRI